MNKKIIFVTNYFGNGGAATVMKVIIEAITNNSKYDISIISFSDDEKKYELPKGVSYYCLSCDTKNSIVKKIVEIFKLRKILKANKDCTIVSFEYFINMKTIIANLFLNNKLIISERNDPSRVGNKKKHIRNFLYRFANVLVCQTFDAKKYFPKKIQDKAVIIPNPIRDDLPEKYNGNRNKNIVTFCRIEKQKNLILMIDAFEIVLKKYPDYKLIIYGDGSEKTKIKKYILEKNLNDSIVLNNFIQNLHSRIVDSAMFVSSSDYEGISNSMLEAMAIGLPTICTDCPCGGARMMIKNGYNGILVPVGDKKQLANSIIKIIEDKNLSKKISNNSIKIKEEISKNKISNEWIKLF